MSKLNNCVISLSLWISQVVIGCDGVNSEVAKFLDLRPPRMSPTCNVRGFTIYPDGHGYPHDFVMINYNRVFLGRIPLDEKSVYWFTARPWTHQGNSFSHAVLFQDSRNPLYCFRPVSWWHPCCLQLCYSLLISKFAIGISVWWYS